MILWILRSLSSIPRLEGPLLDLETGNNKRVEFMKIKEDFRTLVPFLHIELVNQVTVLQSKGLSRSVP